jgi:molecular chaperone GrpE
MEENKKNVPEAEEETGAPEVENTAEEEVEEKPCKGEKKKLKKAEAEIAELKKALESKDAEIAELNDRYMRLFAEYDNFRKRTAKELEGKAADAACDTLAAILPVLDNLERAAQYNTEDSAETPMGKGLELTLKSFIETLSKLGVNEIEADGKTFDPNVHNAVMHVEDEELGESQVVEVFMKGYAKGDKVLRHSMVKVAN